ncbi:MAG: ribose 5-phosphate isomerase A [Anaerolineae bacterium]
MQDDLKRAAADRAAEWIQNGMVVGLGSGSTARFATLRIGARLREGSLRDIVAIPTSEDTAALARELGIPLTTLEERSRIDVTIDGADEVAPNQDVVKGLGGALLREKIVAFASACEIIIVDESKLVSRLGTRAPIPVEVIRFGWHNTVAALERTGAATQVRQAGAEPYITDEGNYIIDCTYPDGVSDAPALAAALNAIPGVVEHGMFLGMVRRVVVAAASGVRIMER